MFKQIMTGLLVFAVLGVPISLEVLTILGLETNYYILLTVGFLLTSLLLFRSILVLFVVTILTLSISLPEYMLLEYSLDKTILICVLLCIILFPSIYKMMND